MSRLNYILLYVKDLQASADFYCRFFGYKQKSNADFKTIELLNSDGGAALLLHPVSKGVKSGQVVVKLVFAVDDVDAFKIASEKNGLKFGATHKGDGYSFANAKDPDNNSISISSRPFNK